MMTTTQRRALTAIGIARIIERGIRANFAPDYQDAELRRLSELFVDMAMSRGQGADLAGSDGESRQAQIDAHWLDAIGVELDR